MSLGNNMAIQDLIHFPYEIDPEDFELAVTVIILLQRVRKIRFKGKPTNLWVCIIFKRREEKGTYYQVINET